MTSPPGTRVEHDSYQVPMRLSTLWVARPSANAIRAATAVLAVRAVRLAPDRGELLRPDAWQA